jgi:hypothetical protein
MHRSITLEKVLKSEALVDVYPRCRHLGEIG